MAKRLPFVVSSKELVKQLQYSTTPKATIIGSNKVLFSNANVHTQGGDPYVGGAKGRDDDIDASGVTGFVADAAKQETEALESVGDAAKDTVDTAWDASKNTARKVLETTTAEADTNVVDTAEYRSGEHLLGQLGDGCDNKKVEI